MAFEVLSFYFWVVIQVALIIGILFFLPFVIYALAISISRRAFYEIVYFSVTIVLLLLRLFSRILDCVLALLEIRTTSQEMLHHMRFFEYLAVAYLDDIINFMLVLGFLVISHRWFQAIVRLGFHGEGRLWCTAPSLVVLLLLVAIEFTSMVVVGIIALVVYFTDFKFIPIYGICHYVTHMFLFLGVAGIFIVVGILLSRILKNMHLIPEGERGAFLKGEFRNLGTLSSRILRITLTIAGFFIFGALMMIYKLLVDLLSLVSMNYGMLPIHYPNFVLSIFNNNDLVRVWALSAFYFVYILFFEIGLSGYITYYYLRKPDTGVTELPNLNDVKKWESNYDGTYAVQNADADEELINYLERHEFQQ